MVGVFYTGSQLWSRCSDKGDLNFGLCRGYVMGIADAMMSGSGLLGRRACLAEGVTGGQAQDVVTRFLEQNPELRNYAAADLATEALADAFPCKP